MAHDNEEHETRLSAFGALRPVGRPGNSPELVRRHSPWPARGLADRDNSTVLHGTWRQQEGISTSVESTGGRHPHTSWSHPDSSPGRRQKNSTPIELTAR